MRHPEVAGSRTDASLEKKIIETDIDELYSLSRKGLWSIFIFLAASALALHFRELTLSGSLPAGLMDQLGPTPPVLLINIVLGVSTICSLIVISGRLYENRRPGNSWMHLSFRVFFYFLYFISNSLNDYFYVVFISGLVVLALQHYNVWNYSSRTIESKMDVWGNLDCDKRVTGK
ncbi:MAG: hypothetical protein ABSA86_10385 [Oryzomonas sp.]